VLLGVLNSRKARKVLQGDWSARMRKLLGYYKVLFIAVMAVTMVASFSDGSASASGHTLTSPETVDLDARLHGDLDPGFAHVSTSGELAAGQDYLVTIEGNWSAWPNSWMTGSCVDPVIHTSPSVPGGLLAGIDASYRYKECQYAAVDYTFYSVDGGSTFTALPRPLNDVYNPDHIYQYIITGAGQQAAFRHGDTVGDDHGVMKITLAPLEDQSATFYGGNGAPGTLVTGTEASFVGNTGPWGPAYIARKSNGAGHDWGTVAGADEWISACPILDDPACTDPDGVNDGDNVFIWYRIQFDVPADWYDATLAFDTKVDNAARVFLNGTPLGGRYQGAGAFSQSLANGALLPGTNSIIVEMEDWGGLSGINYRIDLTGKSTAPIEIIEPDTDGDGVPNDEDEFPTDPTESADTDGDGHGDNGDNCPAVANAAQTDTDGDGIGDACDDPGPPSLDRTPWEMFRPANVIPTTGWSGPYTHGHASLYAFAPDIPESEDSGWGPAPDPAIIGFGHNDFSRLDEAGYACWDAVDFTYFQTFVDIPAATVLTTFSIDFSGMDDGSRITIFNSIHPNGLVVPGSYVYLNNGSTVNLAPYVQPGETNRVVITQVDDCPTGNKLNSAVVNLNGSIIEASNEPPVIDADVDTSDSVYWTDWLTADVDAGTASGVINLPTGPVTVNLQAVSQSGSSVSLYHTTHTGSGTDWWYPAGTFDEPPVLPEGPTYSDVMALQGVPGTVYQVTLSEDIVDPMMAILSLGSGGDEAVYDFDSPFTILTQGNGPWGGHGSALTALPDNKLQGKEGNGVIRFDVTTDEFSWTVPDPETWHGFTFAIRTTVELENTVVVDEGETAVNTGTWGDPDLPDDTVTLSASVGTITDTGAGTWGWSFGTSDGPADSQTVTVTATDSFGEFDVASFELLVNNVAPVVGTDNATVSGDEGTTVSNSGTYSDVGNDIVSVTASPSVGAFTDNGDGTWSWSFDSTDGPDEYGTVTVTVVDSSGASASVDFDWSILNVAPAVDAGDDAGIGEGGTFTGSGSFTDPGDDSWTATVDYGDGSGVQGLALSGNSFDLSHVYVDNGVYTVTVVVEDDDDGVGTDTLTVSVRNIAPVVEPIGNVTIDSGETVVLSASFSDAGVNDIHTASVDWAGTAGSPVVTDTLGSAAGSLSDSHQFFALGDHTVTVTVTDNDGAASNEVTFTVTVVRAPIDIDVKPGSDVNPLNLNGNGVVPVAVLGSAEFDVSILIPGSVLAGAEGSVNAAPVHGGHIEDVNGDGFDDYVFHFREWELGVTGDALTRVPVYLTAEGSDGTLFGGEDDVRINPNNAKSKGKNDGSGKGGPKKK